MFCKLHHRLAVITIFNPPPRIHVVSGEGAVLPLLRTLMTTRRRRFLAIGTFVAVSVAVLVAGVTFNLFMRPTSIVPSQADAVVVPGGGKGERLQRAVELMKSGVAPTLLLSLGGGHWTGPEHVVQEVNRLCNDGQTPFETICRIVVPDSTQGDAIVFSRLANERRWERLIVVTSDYHLFRSVRWFKRCFSGEVFGVGASSDKSISLLAHEWLGLVHATVERSCG